MLRRRKERVGLFDFCFNFREQDSRLFLCGIYLLFIIFKTDPRPASMPRAFLVKKANVSPGKRNWSELPDHERGDVYVPGESTAAVMSHVCSCCCYESNGAARACTCMCVCLRFRRGYAVGARRTFEDVYGLFVVVVVCVLFYLTAWVGSCVSS